MSDIIDEKIQSLIEGCLEQLESSKGNIVTGIKKLRRAAELLEYPEVVIWCEIQAGNITYSKVLKSYINAFTDHQEGATGETIGKLDEAKSKVISLGIPFREQGFYEGFSAELSIKAHRASGGFESIGFIEEKYQELVKSKRSRSPDGRYHKDLLNKHLHLIKSSAHRKASLIYRTIKFKEVPRTSFEFLKTAVDDKLLDLSPEAAEQLMIAFKTVSSDKPEEWSQALTTCRRLIEKVADYVFPARAEAYNGKKVGQSQFINRIWAFMDSTIESQSNKELARYHVEYLGKYIESTIKLTNKGVHSELTKVEAIKTVFHIYLMLADLLGYLEVDLGQLKSKKISINSATIDEIEALLNVKRSLAKEIIKQRIHNGQLTEKILSEVPGIGPKLLTKIKENFSY